MRCLHHPSPADSARALESRQHPAWQRVKLEERVERLTAAKVDAIFVDTAHGHAEAVSDAVLRIKRSYNFV